MKTDKMLLIYSRDGKKYGAEWIVDGYSDINAKRDASKENGLDGITILIDFKNREVTSL